ncbi:MAG: response regulator transcription factor [Pseudomonadota bacterium]
MIRTLIVEDDSLARRELCALVDASEQFTVIASAGSVRSARSCLTLELDLVLLDVSLPDGSGLELIPDILSAHIDAKIVVLTVNSDRATALLALQSGANGYLLKLQTNLMARLQEVMDGNLPIDASITGHLVSELISFSDSQKRKETATPDLTPRELETLSGLAEGLSYVEIAERMRVSPHTINGFIKVIYRKLGVNSRSKAVYEGVKQQLVEL